VLDFIILSAVKQDLEQKNVPMAPRHLNRFCCPCGRTTKHHETPQGDCVCQDCGVHRSTESAPIAFPDWRTRSF
jgi:hypothetical protein